MKSEFFNHNSKPSYALMSTISGHGVFQDSTTSHTIEREDFASTTLVFVHDLQNNMYCLNVFCV